MTDYQKLRTELGVARQSMRVGDIVEGTFADIAVKPSPFGKRAWLLLQDGPGVGINTPAVLEFERLNIQPGDRIRVERLPDAPPSGGQSNGRSQWSVERVQQTGPQVTDSSAPVAKPDTSQRGGYIPAW